MSNRYDPSDLEPVTAPEPRTLPSEHDRSRRSLLGRIAAPVAVALGVLVKFGAIGLKFFGIFLAVGGYALIWGWKFGVGVVLLILVHELGHYVEAKRLGLDPQLPVFIPFLGAYVALRNMRFDPWVNARVSLAGPVAGGVGALACLIVAVQTGSDLLKALAYMGFLLNLINLIPVGILDGGSIWRSIQLARRSVEAPPGQQFAMGSTYPIAIPGGGPTRAVQISVLYGVLAALLVLGMIATHVTQHRL